MLTCIACTKQLNANNGGSTQPEDRDDEVIGTPRNKQAMKSLTSQLKDMAVKASGAYKNCKPCSGASNRNQNRKYADSDAASDSGRFRYAYQRAGTASSTPKIWGKEMESRLKGLSSEEGTPTSMSGRTESLVFMEEDEVKEWVAQVEPGVLITFVSLPQGGNDLKRIRFSRDMFNKWEAQKWWAENFEKVMELYNVQQFNQESVPLPTPPVSEDGGSRIQSAKDSPVTPPLNREQPRGKGYSSSDSPYHQSATQTPKPCDSSAGLASTPKVSSISGTKTETASIDGGSARSSSVDGSEEVSVSNASDVETEWVEQDEPGIYITIRALPDGNRELRRVRFSRDKFGETHARLWWEQNRARIQQQYL
uniref:Protein Brevis radix-like 3 n=1 Tax=Noccaea caerulescens TaxID=107243 RepID=A0A1J3IPS2_NOCCA